MPIRAGFYRKGRDPDMSVSLTLAALWAIVACVIAMLPSRRNHWPAAYGLIATGAPLLVFIALQHGPWVTLACALAAASILRWPLIYLIRKLRG